MTEHEAPQLEHVDLDSKLSKKSYPDLLLDAQKRFVALRDAIIQLRIPIVLVFEGWDASGKGGTIRRLIEYMDTRLLTIHSVAAPTKDELNHHYLWRFWRDLPHRGHIGIFDRSWYGRVLVERIEGFAEQQEWQRAYNEINEFERLLVDDGYLIQKFFLHVSFEEQGRRFDERKTDPLKMWKLTDEDFRNRDKHPQYTDAINDMLKHTHKEHAPWHVIPGNNKRFARVETINRVISAVEDYIKRMS